MVPDDVIAVSRQPRAEQHPRAGGQPEPPAGLLAASAHAAHASRRPRRRSPTSPPTARQRRVSLDEVLDAVADYYRISLDDLRGKQRDKHIVVPRQVAMYLMRQETEASLLEIGQALGGRDHSTVLHGCEKISREVNENTALRKEVLAIRQQFSGSRHDEDYRAFILDLDGVIYRGEQLLPGARELIAWADATGRRLIFLSNNSFATPDEVTAKLARLGVPAPEGRVLTAGAPPRGISRSPSRWLGLRPWSSQRWRAWPSARGCVLVWRDGIDGRPPDAALVGPTST